MILFNGKKEAEEILQDLKKQIAAAGAHPVLAVISIGKDQASELFIKNKKVAAVETNIKIIEYHFAADAKENEVVDKIKQLNEDSNVHGIIIQLPLPKYLNTENIVKEILPAKDVDGFGEEAKFQPPLISAILTALKECENAAQEKEILAIVNSDIFGAILKKFFDKKGLKIKYLLNEDILGKKDIVEKADIVITALGRPKFIKGDMIRKGAALIDAGIIIADLGKVVGDVDKKSVLDKASFLTPVPGGIGPLTVAYLLKNVFLAHERRKNKCFFCL